MPPSEIHVKRFKSKEVDIPNRDSQLVLPCKTGDMLQVGQSSSTCVSVPSGRRPRARLRRNTYFQKKKEKTEIEVQVSTLDMISEILWEITFIGIMLLQERNYAPNDDFPIISTSLDVRPEATHR